MDGDAAGQRAVERLCESPASSGLDSLSEAGVSVSVACIPVDSGCKDPADFLQVREGDEEGGGGWGGRYKENRYMS